jgi:hypothetical protein
MALAYHLAFFSRINPAAPIFAIAFVLQAALFWRFGIARGALRMQLRNDVAGWTGSAAILYALVAYPLLTAAAGHFYPGMPTFGLPCPTTIFTFGLLLWAVPPFPRVLLAVPVLWAVLGISAAVSLRMPPDYGLPVAALAAVAIAFSQRRPRARFA